MTGFVIFGGIALIAFAVLALLRLPRALWSFAGAALLLGAIGYTWQGRPALAAHPVRAGAEPIEVDPEMVAFRERLLGRFTADTAYLTASDAMLRAGDSGAAVAVILGGIRKLPRSFILWTQLGTTMAIHDGEQVSPAAAFAFQQAMRIAPAHPAPPYYAGLAFLRAGNFPAARQQWARALALSPAGTGYRAEILEQLTMLSRYMAMDDRIPAAAGAAAPPG